MRRLLLLLLTALFLPCLAFAQSSEAAPSAESGSEYFMEASPMRPEYDFWSEFTHMLSILAAIILFLLGAAWVMRRLLNVRMESINQNSHIRIIERRTMSPKSAIYLLEVGEQQMLVGESAAGLHPLGTLKENVDSQPEPGLSFAETMDRRTAQGGSEDAS